MSKIKNLLDFPYWFSHWRLRIFQFSSSFAGNWFWANGKNYLLFNFSKGDCLCSKNVLSDQCAAFAKKWILQSFSVIFLLSFSHDQMIQFSLWIFTVWFRVLQINCHIFPTAVKALVWNNGTLLCKIDFTRNLSFKTR